MSNKLKIYAEKRLCVSEKLSSLNPILAFHWEGLSEDERREGKANPSSTFILVNSPSQADICVLPREWHYYIWHNKQIEASSLAKQAERSGKNILVWHRGDLPPVIPMNNAVVFKSAMDRSRRKNNQFAAPYFIPDPTQTYSDGQALIRQKGAIPVIGFCGYAGVKPIKMIYGAASNLKRNLSFYFGRSNYETIPVLPATMLRARALKLLSGDRRVRTQFIIRDKYNAGQKRKSPQTREKSLEEAEFYHNIYQTDYTVCIRGYGNWSVRFYETLACGRIPVFVDTDCVLPFNFSIDWKNYCVWVERSELPYIAEKVADFHADLSEDEFMDRQQSCRKLWMERLSLHGFMNHISEHFRLGAGSQG